MVVFDDAQWLCWPPGFDPDCEGAPCGSTDEMPAVVFPDRNIARQSITIFKRLAALHKAQGKARNLDFTEAVKCVKIMFAQIV